MAAVPRDGHDRPVRHLTRTSRRASSTGTRSTPTCSSAPKPRTGARYAADSQSAQPGLQAAAAHDRRPRRRREAVASGSPATPSRTADFFFVEAHTAGADDWTTLPDEDGHTERGHRRSTAPVCSRLHPFLAHYQTAQGGGACRPTGHDRRVAGRRPARATATSTGRSTSRLRRPDGRGLAHATSSDDARPVSGVVVDDVVVHRRGHDLVRGRRRHARRLDGPGRAAPAARRTPNDWIVGTAATGADARSATSRGAAFARQPEILDFLAEHLRAVPVLGRRLDRRRRPRPRLRAREPDPADLLAVVLRDRARRRGRQRGRPRARPPVGRRRLALASWQHIWLNEGFATYAEWLWSEHEGRDTAQESFDFCARRQLPADDRSGR